MERCTAAAGGKLTGIGMLHDASTAAGARSRAWRADTTSANVAAAAVRSAKVEARSSSYWRASRDGIAIQGIPYKAAHLPRITRTSGSSESTVVVHVDMEPVIRHKPARASPHKPIQHIDCPSHDQTTAVMPFP